MTGESPVNRNMKRAGKKYSVSSSLVRRYEADRPVSHMTIIPATSGFPGLSDEVVLHPGQWLEIISHGSSESWGVAAVRQSIRYWTVCPSGPVAEFTELNEAIAACRVGEAVTAVAFRPNEADPYWRADGVAAGSRTVRYRVTGPDEYLAEFSSLDRAIEACKGYEVVTVVAYRPGEASPSWTAAETFRR